ncbi:MAG: hypothetical protein QOJ69_111 [Actinomycetota bacterium]|nr:hypothetical protein [Actinomycetota bacterium]
MAIRHRPIRWFSNSMGPAEELSLLGGFILSVEGDALLGISAGAQRLLAFLAVRDHTVRRQHAAGTLWPDAGDERANANLRSTISRLDQTTRQSVTVTAHDLGLQKGLVIDIHDSQALARRLIDSDAPPLDSDVGGAAVSALSDDLLPGWDDDWAVIAAEDWHQLRLHALEAIAARLTAAGRLAEAANAALAAIRAEPLRETSRAALIRVRMAEGKPSDARQEFERYRVLLHAELALEPTSRLRQLLRSIRPE